MITYFILFIYLFHFICYFIFNYFLPQTIFYTGVCSTFVYASVYMNFDMDRFLHSFSFSVYLEQVAGLWSVWCFCLEPFDSNLIQNIFSLLLYQIYLFIIHVCFIKPTYIIYIHTLLYTKRRKKKMFIWTVCLCEMFNKTNSTVLCEWVCESSAHVRCCIALSVCVCV